MWYLQTRTGLAGPFTDDELIKLANDGKVTPKSVIRSENDRSWHLAEKIQGLFTPQNRLPGVTPGQQLPPSMRNPSTSVRSKPPEIQTTTAPPQLPQSEILSVLTRSASNNGLIPIVVLLAVLPLGILLAKDYLGLDLAATAFLLGLFFCTCCGIVLHHYLKPPIQIWKRAIGFSLFTIAVGIPLLLIAQNGPVFRELYSQLDNRSTIVRLIAFIAGVGFLEEFTKALPLFLFSLQKREKLSRASGLILGISSGFGFAIAEGVSYSLQYGSAAANESLSIFDTANHNSTSVHSETELARNAHSSMVELYGHLMLAQIVRLSTLPLLHAGWSGILGFFIARASRYSDRSQQIGLISVGLASAAALHGAYDTFSNNFGGLIVAAISVAWCVGCIVGARHKVPETGSNLAS